MLPTDNYSIFILKFVCTLYKLNKFDNMSKTFKDIQKCTQDSSNYINDHGMHYQCILKKYVLQISENQGMTDDEMNRYSKRLFSDFIRLFIKLQMFVTEPKFENVNHIFLKINTYKVIFVDIIKNITLSTHETVDVLTIKVHTKILSKLFKSIKNKKCFESHILNPIQIKPNCNTNPCNLHNGPLNSPSDCPLNSPSDCPLNSPSDCPLNSPSDCPSNSPSNCQLNSPLKCQLKCPLKCQLNDPPNCLSSSPSDGPLNGPLNCLKNSNQFEFLKKHKKYLKSIILGIKNIYQILNTLNVIIDEMQKEFLQKINCYNLYNPTSNVNSNDVEYNNKLLNTSFEQMTQLITNVDNNIFNPDMDIIPINIFLNNGKTIKLFSIDNFRIRLELINCFQCILIDIGNKQYKITFLKSTLDNAGATIILKNNFIELKSVLENIIINKKLMLHWLKLLKKNIN